VLVDKDGDITIKENECRGSEGLRELLTCKNVNKENLTSDDLRKYKKIVLLTTSHLEGYQTGGVINDGRGKKFRENFAPFSSCRIGVTLCMEKILRWPPGHYITIRPKRQLFGR